MKHLWGVSMLMWCVLSACGGGGGSSGTVEGPGLGSTTMPVQIEFAAMAGAVPVACGTAVSGLGRVPVAALNWLICAFT